MLIPRICVSVGFLLISIAPSFAQRNDLAKLIDFPVLLRPAGYVFAGRVTAVQYVRPKAPNELPTVRITFAIEQGIRGIRSGDTLTVRQWAGLWNADERYRVGERVVLFLYPPSRLGLTSSVGGLQGRFAVDRDGKVVLPPGSITNPASATRPTNASTRVPLRDFTRAIRQARIQER